MGIATITTDHLDKSKMKFSPAPLFAVAAADDKKVPPRHPLQRLERLNEFTDEMLNSWFDFLPSKDAWVEKFAANGARMATAFTRGNQRCGFYDESQEHGGPERKRREVDDVERYNREDPVEGVRQLTTGYRKWAERYLSQCSGQRNYQHQAIRMAKWHDLLQAHLAGQDPDSIKKFGGFHAGAFPASCPDFPIC